MTGPLAADAAESTGEPTTGLPDEAVARGAVAVRVGAS